MDNMEEKMNAILNDPQMMGKILTMAQTLSRPESTPDESKFPPDPGSAPKEGQEFSMPEIDPSMLQKLSGFVGQNRIDSNQQSLLRALSPYLSRDRIHKLEKAMRAARLAKVASSLMGSSVLQSFFGR